MSSSGSSRGATPINWITVTLSANIITAAGARTLQAGLDAQGFVRFRGGPIQNNTGAAVAVGATFATVDPTLFPTTTAAQISVNSPGAQRVVNIDLAGNLSLAAGNSTWGAAATMAFEGAQYFQNQ